MAIERLRDVNPLKAYTLNEQELNNYVFKKERIDIDFDKTYDIAFVLGCGIYEIMKHRADDAINLYRQGIVDTLLLTGGIGFLSKNRDYSEASVMRSYMLSKGISDSDIIIEDKSRNTYENMKNSIRQIQYGFKKDGKIIIVTSDFHSKRSKGMLEKMTTFDVYAYGSLDGKFDLNIWNNNLSSIMTIRKEALLLSWYVQKGIIDNQEVDEVSFVKRKTL